MAAGAFVGGSFHLDPEELDRYWCIDPPTSLSVFGQSNFYLPPYSCLARSISLSLSLLPPYSCLSRCISLSLSLRQPIYVYLSNDLDIYLLSLVCLFGSLCVPNLCTTPRMFLIVCTIVCIRSSILVSLLSSGSPCLDLDDPLHPAIRTWIMTKTRSTMRRMTMTTCNKAQQVLTSVVDPSTMTAGMMMTRTTMTTRRKTIPTLQLL